MSNIVSDKLFHINNDRDFLFTNFLLTIILVVVSFVCYYLILNDTPIPDVLSIVIPFFITLIVLFMRSFSSISFGANIKATNSTVFSNKTMVSFSLVAVVDLILVFYFIFYYQINDLIPPDVLAVIIGPIIIIAVVSIFFTGLENIVYSFAIGILALTLFVDQANVHHTMGEFLVLYSFGSTLIISALYIFPGLLLGIGLDKYLNISDKKLKKQRIFFLSFIPLVIIFFVHLSLLSYVFANWNSF